MDQDRNSSQSVATWVELVVVLVIIGVLAALLLPAISTAREAARRMTCLHNLKRIGMALQNYATANKVIPPGTIEVIPPGTICLAAPIQPANQYDVWGEAGNSDRGSRGTSFLLPLLPLLEAEPTAKAWDYDYGVGGNAIDRPKTPPVAGFDFKRFYCPSRRDRLRPGDSAMMLSSSWTGGGTDYGGCAGRHAALTLKTGYNLCDATMYYEPNFFPKPFKGKDDDTPEKRWGIFGRVNVSTKLDEIKDGSSNTIIVGELQRITDLTPGSKDGWAIGGPATLFTTGAMIHRDRTTLTNVANPAEGSLMSNGFWGSPGSDHPGGANFGFGDASMRFVCTMVDPNVFALLGSMADGEPVKPGNE
jgi:type II secretory pathway pseudopilin PulG